MVAISRSNVRRVRRVNGGGGEVLDVLIDKIPYMSQLSSADRLILLCGLALLGTVAFASYFLISGILAGSATADGGLAKDSDTRLSPTDRMGVSDQASLHRSGGKRIFDDWDVSNSEMNKLKNISLPHGSFFFGPDSHQVDIPESDVFDPSASWSSLQHELLDDDSDAINVELEKKRCATYDFGFPDATMPLKRRRLFYGALISGDSAEVIKATSMEQYNIYHTVSLIESNTTQNLTPKKWRFFGSKDASKELNWLYQLFGPKTKVSVDYYVTSQRKDQIDGDELLIEYFQREGHSYRWKFNGMRPDDIAIIADIDETFSRDFLRALQICDVPQFRPGQSCREPKVLGSTLIFESSPECAWKGRRWFHPDAILGECADQIGDTKLHPPTKRDRWESHGTRLDYYGHDNEYTYYDTKVLADLNMEGQGPLWLPHDFRREEGGEDAWKNDEWESPTAYHFHNFFMSGEEVRFKYSTYGHADSKALVKSLRHIHADGDIMLAVMCALGNHTEDTESSFESIAGTSRPIYYLNKEARQARHSMWQDIVRRDEEMYGQSNDIDDYYEEEEDEDEEDDDEEDDEEADEDQEDDEEEDEDQEGEDEEEK
mmetsp:Transcript_28205/g.56754  ORF Transcript_28205/g.56754 Transcript_28205/m.56754 type:complete len:602 (-) Transcript_28205:165-1970(-)